MKSLLITFLALLLGCAPEKPAENQPSSLTVEFRAALCNIGAKWDDSDVVAYVIIPNTGCSGCITSAETFLKNTVSKSDKLRFILTNIASVKMLKLKIGNKIVDHPNVYIDKENMFYKGSFNSIYPTILFIDQKTKEISRRSEVSPTENGIGELMKILHIS